MLGARSRRTLSALVAILGSVAALHAQEAPRQAGVGGLLSRLNGTQGGGWLRQQVIERIRDRHMRGVAWDPANGEAREIGGVHVTVWRPPEAVQGKVPL